MLVWPTRQLTLLNSKRLIKQFYCLTQSLDLKSFWWLCFVVGAINNRVFDHTNLYPAFENFLKIG
jgi:hypothetical protein